MNYATIKRAIASLLAVLICSMPVFAQGTSDRADDARQKVEAIKER